MNIGTHFDYIGFISTHTKRSIHMKRHLFCANGSEFADWAFWNIAATFHQCLISDCKQTIDTG